MAKLKMLLVDDDSSMVRLLSVVISRSFRDAIELTQMTDSKEAKDWIHENSPDIVLTDLEMPGFNGIDILQAAKKRNTAAQVLMLTAHSSANTLFETLEYGASDYFLKPVDQSELVSVLQQACDRVTRWKRALRGTMVGAG